MLFRSGNGYAFTVDPPKGNQASIQYVNNFDFSSLNNSSFKVTVSSTVANKNGGFASDTATVFYKMIRSMAVTPTSGISDGKAAYGTNVSLSAVVDGWNLDATNKYVTWKLQYKVGNDVAWKDCTDSGIATMYSSRVDASIALGSKVNENYKFRVVATSTFDDTWNSEYIFGIYEPEPEMGNDDPSRGVEIDILAYFKKNPQYIQNITNIISISNVTVSGTANFDETSGQMIKIGGSDGKYYLYLDYENFKYQSVMQIGRAHV